MNAITFETLLDYAAKQYFLQTVTAGEDKEAAQQAGTRYTAARQIIADFFLTGTADKYDDGEGHTLTAAEYAFNLAGQLIWITEDRNEETYTRETGKAALPF